MSQRDRDRFAPGNDQHAATDHRDRGAERQPPRLERAFGTMEAGDVLALQRTAGNSAVARMLGRASRGSSAAGVLARSVIDDVTSMTITRAYASSLSDVELEEAIAGLEARQDAPDPALEENLRVLKNERLSRRVEGVDATANAALDTAMTAITEAQRAELYRTAGFRILGALDEYIFACVRVKTSLAAAARADAEILAMVIDVGTGFLAPGLARGIAGLANRLPARASTAAYRAALAGLDTDMSKALFTGAAKVGNSLIKNNATALFGEADTDMFINQLVSQTRRGFTAISENLPTLTDPEVGVICLAFDPTVTTNDIYAEAINGLVRRFESEVLPVGEFSRPVGEFDLPRHTTLAYIRRGATRRLAQVVYRPTFFFGGDYWFNTWISPDMEPLARARHGNLPMEELDAADVKGF